MKHAAVTTAFLMVLTCFQSAWAYSAIWNVDGWDAARLKEAGIAVTTWKHDQIGEDPAMNWVKITYDPSKLREAPNVLMTLHVIGDDGQTVSAFRAERKKGEANKPVILCAVRKENMEKTRGACSF